MSGIWKGFKKVFSFGELKDVLYKDVGEGQFNLKRTKQLEYMEWYFGNLGRPEAEDLLNAVGKVFLF